MTSRADISQANACGVAQPVCAEAVKPGLVAPVAKAISKASSLNVRKHAAECECAVSRIRLSTAVI